MLSENNHDTVCDDTRPLDEIKASIREIQEEQAANGRPLSGRVIHVCHYIPVICSVQDPQPLTPPRTPDTTTHQANVLASGVGGALPAVIPDEPIKWTIQPRSGHSAMISGIGSLSDLGEQVIVGWTGEILRDESAQVVPSTSVQTADRKHLEKALHDYKETHESRPLGLEPVWLDDKIARGHYEGYCKNILWPLFHYLLWQDAASESVNVDSDWQAYVAANEAYAEQVAAVHQPGDLVWIHDYHLLLVPAMLRKLKPDASIGLFVHTPFPSSEVFRCLPRRKEVLDGMLGANIICFQTYSYSRHFISSCIRVCGYESVHGGIDVGGHLASVGHCAVGIDADRVNNDSALPEVQPKLTALRNLYEGKKIIVGRDKLDVVKGVVQKLKAFEHFLRYYPEWRGNVVLIQVTSPALTDSAKLEHQVSELVSKINGEFGSLDFIPVHHYHQIIKKEEFYALLSAADLALVTPLRDGMNTTSMEFVLCQQKASQSPLILSEFMGISSNMPTALQVNPWNLGDVAAAINQGLIMSHPEKLQRQAALYSAVTTHTSHSWAANLLHMIVKSVDNVNAAHQTPYLDKELLVSQYQSAKKRLFLFDYDGTLTPIVRVPSMAIPSEQALSVLSELLSDPKNTVYIISGRDGTFLEQHFGDFKKLGLSAEHGSFLRAPGADEWENLTETFDMSWMSDVEEIFKYYTERTTGSHIEMKKCSITWHYRASDPEWGLFQCRQCQDLLENNLVHKKPIEVLVGKKNLEVRPVAISKGEIVKRLLCNNPDADFVFCAGDDKTDEDMFRSLRLFPPGSSQEPVIQPSGSPTPVTLSIQPNGIFTTTVGASTKKTLASWHVTTPQEIVESMEILTSSGN